MRLLVAAGGTGGGVYPALAVVGALVASESAEVLWIGGEGGMEATLVNRAGIELKMIPAAGVHGVGLRALPGNLTRTLRGVGASRELIREFEPDALFFTGGYVGVPVAFAGRRLPQAIFVPDIEPALALRWISRWARAIMISTEDSRSHYREDQNVIMTGYPTRPTLNPVPKAQARQSLGLDPDFPTVLVFGGSRGARSINQALWASLHTLLPEMQVMHITGQLDWPEVEGVVSELGPTFQGRYRAHAYVHEEMAQFFSAADLVVSRAGAACLGEYPLFGLPAILVPYPHAWRYQWTNASYLEKNGGAKILKDEDLLQLLGPQIRALMADGSERQRMRAAMRALHKPNAATHIASILRGLPDSGRGANG